TKCPSRMCQTGFQYTPVASIATCVHRALSSHSASANNPCVVVGKRRTSRSTFRSLIRRRQATTSALCTSRPAHLLCNVFIATSLRRGRHEALALRTLLTVFREAFTHAGKSLSVDDNYRCSKGLRSNSLTGSLAPRRRRPPRRPQHSLPCFMHPGAQRPWQLIRSPRRRATARLPALHNPAGQTRSVGRTIRLPQSGRLVLGTDLNRSEWWFSFISKGFYSAGFRVFSVFTNSRRAERHRLRCRGHVKPCFMPPAPRQRARKRLPKPDRSRALELLATSPDGATEAVMLAHGFTVPLRA